MGIIDVVIIAVIAAAFAAVVLRIRKKGMCGSCSNEGSCGGSCAGCSASKRKTCPACSGIDETAQKLSQGISKR